MKKKHKKEERRKKKKKKGVKLLNILEMKENF